MKLYNPFRWHVIEAPSGKYAIRRRSFLGLWWTYADIAGDDYVWSIKTHVAKYCYTTDKARAIDLATRLRGRGKVIWP